MSKLAWEKPTIIKHAGGLANKVGRGASRNTLSRIDGVAVEDLIERFGTPLFVFSEHRLRQRAREAKRAFSLRYPKVQFSWSYKTNYLDAVCRIFHQEGAWAEVVSEMEYDMARRLGVPPEQILFNGPYKPEAALRTALKDGARVHIDHYEELYEAERIAKELGRVVPISIRVNMDTGIHPRWDRFGFNLDNGEALDAARRIHAGGALTLDGLHCHIGTFILEPGAYGQAAAKMADLAKTLRSETGMQIDFLDLGGGFASRATLHGQYAPGTDSSPALDDYAEAITSALLSAGFSPEAMPTLLLETGRALVDEAGFMLTRVVGNKRLADGSRSIIIDAGLNVLFTSLWYRHDVLPVTDRGGMQEETVVYGPLCMNIDVVRPMVLLPPLEAGDPLVIRPVGAYNVTQWMQFIRLRPAVVLVGEDGTVDVIREAETVDDVKGPERLPERLKLKA
jgi:diaminopimelate decarboxylase